MGCTPASRFNGFLRKTVENGYDKRLAKTITSLKRGVNESGCLVALSAVGG
jgi:hypothetical protein